MTLYQVIKFYLLQGRYTIWESHIMTIVFSSLLATSVSLALSNWTERIEKRRVEVELREARLRTLQVTMQHIVNNFLNCVMLIRLEAEEDGTISQDSLEKLEEKIQEVSKQLTEIGELDDPGNSEEFRKFFPSKK